MGMTIGRYITSPISLTSFYVKPYIYKSQFQLASQPFSQIHIVTSSLKHQRSQHILVARSMVISEPFISVQVPQKT